jgi:hypothetical protein
VAVGRGEAGDALRQAAMRLAAELDAAGLYRAAAHAGMAGGRDRRRAEAGDLGTDVELEFDADEHGRAWMYQEGDCHMIGRTQAACAEMRRFLKETMLGPVEPQ